MAKVKVRVLYPTAFAAQGIDTENKEELSLEKEQAETLIAQGFAEEIGSTKKAGD